METEDGNIELEEVKMSKSYLNKKEFLNVQRSTLENIEVNARKKVSNHLMTILNLYLRLNTKPLIQKQSKY